MGHDTGAHGLNAREAVQGVEWDAVEETGRDNGQLRRDVQIRHRQRTANSKPPATMSSDESVDFAEVLQRSSRRRAFGLWQE